MDWNIPWRKTLASIILIQSLNNIFSEPLTGMRHNPKWKSEVKNQSVGIIGERNDYKILELSSFNVYNNDFFKRQLSSKTHKQWSKYLRITYKRLLPYRDFIAGEIEKENVPFELLFLPIIESAAYSKATSKRGATGLWQFMSNSSGAYNMRTTEWLDERRDFVKSTRGAIAKLKYNYKVTGDWLLALAAYNCGLNRVKTIVKTTGINDYWKLSKKGLLPKETINYIPKLLAISSLLQNKNSYNIPIKWDKYDWVEIELTQALDLRMLSENSGVPLKILKEGNVELNYSVTPPVYRNYRLKVPVKYSDNITKALSNNNKLIEFYRYKVQSGDTLSEIGLYYGLTTGSLIKYNPGISARTLRIGKTLIVPALKRLDPYRCNRVTVPFNNNYIVKNGDTLWDIAVKYKTTVEEIALNSGLGINSYIKKGMRLKVP